MARARPRRKGTAVNKRWIAYGVGGALGIGVLAGAAALTAQAMELRTDDGTVLDGGGIEADLSPAVQATPSPAVTPVPTPSATPTTKPKPQPSAPVAPPVVEQPAPPAGGGGAPVTVTPPSPVSLASAPSAD